MAACSSDKSTGLKTTTGAFSGHEYAYFLSASGAIYCWSVDPVTGALTPTAPATVLATADVIVLTPDKQFLLAGRYADSTVIRFRIASNGGLTRMDSVRVAALLYDMVVDTVNNEVLLNAMAGRYPIFNGIDTTVRYGLVQFDLGPMGATGLPSQPIGAPFLGQNGQLAMALLSGARHCLFYYAFGGVRQSDQLASVPVTSPGVFGNVTEISGLASEYTVGKPFPSPNGSMVYWSGAPSVSVVNADCSLTGVGQIPSEAYGGDVAGTDSTLFEAGRTGAGDTALVLSWRIPRSPSSQQNMDSVSAVKWHQLVNPRSNIGIRVVGDVDGSFLVLSSEIYQGATTLNVARTHPDGTVSAPVPGASAVPAGQGTLDQQTFVTIRFP
jgi:hypothetical protein